MRKGRKSAAQTKAPIKDRIKGSTVNKKGSASSTAKAIDIVLSDEITEALSKKAKDFNQENKQNKVSLSTLKAVFRRGAGAFSVSHRPNMTRNGWAYARVNKFLEKKSGKAVKKAYVQDDDLMENGGQIQDNGLLSSIYPEIKQIFADNGLILREDYSFTDGSNKSYLAYTGMQKVGENVEKVAITYYENGYEVLGEVIIEVDLNGQIDILVEFPNWQVYEKIQIMKKGGKLKSAKSLMQIAKEKGVTVTYAFDQLKKGMEFEKEHSDDKKIQKAIALQHLDENIDYYKKLAKMESTFEKGGEVDADDPKIKNEMIHKSGKVGGLLVGKRHSEGGIKAINKSNNSPLEMEGGEVVITRNAVSDDAKREFEGEMLTNREILSRINEGGGGVSFAEGGDIPEHIMVSGKEYKYGGATMKDSDIVYDCGCNHKMADGGSIEWGEDLGDGFHVGSDVYITDKKSMFKDKTGFISGLAGNDLLVTISQNGNERNIIVSKKGVQVLDAPEFADGGTTESKYYQGFEIGEDGTYRIPNQKDFGIKHKELKNSDAFSKMYGEKYKDGGELGTILLINKRLPSYIDFKNNNKNINLHTSKSSYKNLLKNKYNVSFDDLPTMIQMGLLLGNQKLVDNYINA